jgi:hypothetical protein
MVSFFIGYDRQSIEMVQCRFDYKRKADGSMPVGVADERPVRRSHSGLAHQF